jgi:hypothetical protein
MRSARPGAAPPPDATTAAADRHAPHTPGNPLTITDFSSRYLMPCESLSTTKERYAFSSRRSNGSQGGGVSPPWFCLKVVLFGASDPHAFCTPIDVPPMAFLVVLKSV